MGRVAIPATMPVIATLVNAHFTGFSKAIRIKHPNQFLNFKKSKLHPKYMYHTLLLVDIF